MQASASQVGVVAIGRNEGERLKRCLQSASKQCELIVYVDSGSNDDSIAIAESLGAIIVRLDLSKPFTAARSRNAGIERLRSLFPHIQYVQVVDGDCEIAEGWIDQACSAMADHAMAAVICGRRRERFPNASVFNKLCDMEWDTPLGETNCCGGDALMRLDAFKQINGYNDSLIAGEEPEMCLRLRRSGWTIHRIDYEMTLHDANMTTFSQWWKRMVRSGHAYAEGRALHGRSSPPLFVEEVRSILEWALLLPLIALALAWVTWGASLLLFVGYVLLWHRVRAYQLTRCYSKYEASLYARYCVLGKFAELVGVATYWWNRIRGRRSTLIEYKGAARMVIEPLAQVQKQ